MLANGTHHSNDIQTTTAYPACPSDYEAVAIDVTPRAGWHDQFPQFTHNVSWMDTDSKQHSLTIRCDDLDELLATLTAVKQTIRASKAKHTESQPGEQVPAQQAESQPDVLPCHIHGVNMPRRWSKRTNGHYFAHKLATGDFCYGKAKWLSEK